VWVQRYPPAAKKTYWYYFIANTMVKPRRQYFTMYIIILSHTLQTTFINGMVRVCFVQKLLRRNSHLFFPNQINTSSSRGSSLALPAA